MMKLLFENWRGYLKERLEDIPDERVRIYNPVLAKEMLNELKPYAGKKWVFFDTETQGFSATGEQLTEIGAIVVDTGMEFSGDELIWKNPPKIVDEFNQKAFLDARSIEAMSIYYCLASKKSKDIQPLDTEFEETVMKTLKAVLEKEKIDCSQYEPYEIVGYVQKGKRDYPEIRFRDNPEVEPVYGTELGKISGRGKKGRMRGYVTSMTNYLGNENVKRTDELTLLEDFVEFLDKQGGTEDVVLVIQNAKFDMKMISRRFRTDPETGKAPHRGTNWWKGGKVFDTVALFKQYFIPLLKTINDKELMNKIKKGRTFSVSQGILANAFEVNAENWHTAIADVEMLMGVLYEVSKYIQEHGDVDIRGEFEKAYPKPKLKRWKKK